MGEVALEEVIFVTVVWSEATAGLLEIPGRAAASCAGTGPRDAAALPEEQEKRDRVGGG